MTSCGSAPARFRFTRGQCLTGPERGTVLVRSVWLAEVELRRGKRSSRSRNRRVVPPDAVEEELSLGRRMRLWSLRVASAYPE